MSPEIIAALKANAQAPSSSTQGRARWTGSGFVLDDDDEKMGRGGTATSLISELGGAGGAAGGAAIGTAILPGVGTIAGGLIGGFLGGAGGAAAEQKVRDDEVRLADVLQEGAISGVFGGAGAGYNVLKGGAKAGGTLAKSGGKLAGAGDDLIAKSRGITPAAGKTSTRAGLSTKEAKRLNELASSMGLTKSTPKANLEALESAKSTLLTQRHELLKNAGKLPKNSLSNIQKNIVKTLDQTPGVSSLDDIADDLAKMGKKDSVKGLTGFRQNIDEMINFNRASATPDPLRERTLKIVRQSIDGELTKVNPAIKSINSTLSSVYDIEDLLQEATKRQIAGTGAMQVPFAKTKLPAGTTQAVQNASGRVLQAPGRLAGALSGGGAAGKVAKGVATRGVANSMLSGGSQEEMTAPEAPQTTDLATALQSAQMQTLPSDSPFAPQNIEANVQSILQQGGKFSDVEDYLSLAETINKVQGVGQTGGLELNNTAITRVADFESGINALDQLGQRIGDSGVNKPIIGDLRRRNPFDTEAQDLNSAIRSVRQLVGRALEGGVLRREDEIKYEQMLPKIGDTDAVAKAKIANVRQLLTGNLNSFLDNQGRYSGGTEDIMYGAQYGQATPGL